MMIRPFACAIFSATLLAAIPALSQSSGTMTRMNCSDASMKTVHDSMMKMPDAAKKAEVMKEMDMAKDMMAKKDEKNCIAKLENAMAMTTGMGMMMGMDMSMMAPNPNDAASTKGYKAAMMKMMEGMPMMKFTGDADLDFMTHMRAHHQNAVDMAKVVLATGKDDEVKKLAREIITAQEKEIVAIDAWLKANKV